MKQWAVKLTLDYGLADHTHKENQTFVERREVWFQLSLPFWGAGQIPTPTTHPAVLKRQNLYEKACKFTFSSCQQVHPEEGFHPAFPSCTVQRRPQANGGWRWSSVAGSDSDFPFQDRAYKWSSLNERYLFWASVPKSSTNCREGTSQEHLWYNLPNGSLPLHSLPQQIPASSWLPGIPGILKERREAEMPDPILVPN